MAKNKNKTNQNGGQPQAQNQPNNPQQKTRDNNPSPQNNNNQNNNGQNNCGQQNNKAQNNQSKRKDNSYLLNTSIAVEPYIDEEAFEGLRKSLIQVSDYMRKVQWQREALVIALSNVDKELSDLHHYIELNRFSASDAWFTFKRLQQTLQRRRKIKDYLNILNQYELNNCDGLSTVAIYAKNLESRQYSPRILDELFEEGPKSILDKQL